MCRRYSPTSYEVGYTCSQYTKNMFSNIFLFLKIVQTFAICIRGNGVLFDNIWHDLLNPKSASSKFSVSYCNI